MSNGFSIDPEKLRESGYAIGRAAHQLETEMGGFEMRLAGGDSVWGGDEVGAAFRGIYREVADAAIRALEAMAVGITDVGEAVRATADDTEENDRAAQAELTRLLDSGR